MTPDDPHMQHGDQLLKAYVSECIKGTPFGRPDEPITKFDDKDGDVGFGTTGFRVFATDQAINVIGTYGPAAFEGLGSILREAAERPKGRLSSPR